MVISYDAGIMVYCVVGVDVMDVIVYLATGVNVYDVVFFGLFGVIFVVLLLESGLFSFIIRL